MKPNCVFFEFLIRDLYFIVTPPNLSPLVQLVTKTSLLTLGCGEEKARLFQGSKQGTGRQASNPLQLAVQLGFYFFKQRTKRLELIIF